MTLIVVSRLSCYNSRISTVLGVMTWQYGLCRIARSLESLTQSLNRGGLCVGRDKSEIDRPLSVYQHDGSTRRLCTLFA